MIKIFTLNVCEEVLNNLKNFEVHSYSDNFSIPVAYIFEDDTLIRKILLPTHVGINTSIFEFRR